MRFQGHVIDFNVESAPMAKIASILTLELLRSRQRLHRTRIETGAPVIQPLDLIQTIINQGNSLEWPRRKIRILLAKLWLVWVHNLTKFRRRRSKTEKSIYEGLDVFLMKVVRILEMSPLQSQYSLQISCYAVLVRNKKASVSASCSQDRDHSL